MPSESLQDSMTPLFVLILDHVQNSVESTVNSSKYGYKSEKCRQRVSKGTSKKGVSQKGMGMT